MESERKELCDDELEKVTGGGKGGRPYPCGGENLDALTSGAQSVSPISIQGVNALGTNDVTATGVNSGIF